MEFTKIQTSIIVLEIIFIFCGIVAIFRAIKPKAATDFSSSALVSTTTAVQNAIYIPPTDEIFKKMDSKSAPEKSVTIEFGETKKKSGNTINLDDEKPAAGKKKKTKKESEVITIDLGEEEKK
ncbi:MAG: hypothetical protein Q7K21_06565 [Elusimicrobiota bacterium]|nr:hypothetical protein [Elusimicrobiota bacterium]